MKRLETGLLRLLLATSCVLQAPTVHAGSRGFTAVFVDIGAQHFFDSALYDAFTIGFSEVRKNEQCWESSPTGGKRFSLIIKKKLPEGMTQELALAVWAGDLGAARRAQAVMKNAGRVLNGNTIDGLYVLKGKDGVISMMSLGARGSVGPKNPSRKVTIAWNNADPENAAAEFDYALCSIVHPLGVGFSP